MPAHICPASLRFFSNKTVIAALCLLLLLITHQPSISQDLSDNLEDFLDIFERHYLSAINTTPIELGKKNHQALIVAFGHCLGKQRLLPSNSRSYQQQFQLLIQEAKNFLFKELKQLGISNISTQQFETFIYDAMTGKYDQFVANNFGIQTRNVPSLFLEGRYRAIAIADIPNMNRYQPSQPIPDNNRQDNSLVAGYWMSNFLTIQVHEEQGKFTGRITWAADAKRLKSEFGWNLGQTAFQVILSEETTNYLKYSGVSPQTDNSGKFGINERFSFTVQTLNGRRFLTLRGYGNQLNLYLNN